MADLIPVDYTAADYADIRADVLRRAERLIPEWTSRSEADFGVVMAELFAHTADLNNYGIDRLLRESFLPTASTLTNVLLLAEMLGYIPHGPVPAQGQITLVSDPGGPEVEIPAGTVFVSDYIDAIDQPIYYETVETVTVPADGAELDVDIVEGRTVVKAEIGMSTGQQAQRIVIPQQRILHGSVRIYVQDEHADLEWLWIPRLTYASGSDLVFTSRPDASGATIISFGDGVTGAVPPLGAKIYATYRVGLGGAGNLPAGSLPVISSPVSGVTIQVDSAGKPMVTALDGGADRESIEEIRRNAALAYSAYGRAVTTADFAKIALTVPGVVAANAISSVASSVIVYIAGPGRTVPADELVVSVIDQLASASAAGTRVTVSGPTIISVNFGSVSTPMRLTVAPTYRRSVVETLVRTQLNTIVASADNAFGSRISVGEVYGALAAIPGVVNVTIPVMARADSPQTGVADIVLQPWEIPVMGTATIETVGGVT
ncbi:hypothetical protein FDA94_29175 [Herbidospora galbida]|uniref:Uncharacterized protein n=1 Tax=Herbidospora galbida TaxID=2575442 RepID=A0A4U3M6W9_9ACTN|nr:baseplate J/gp47 family protein [Herbidospora galbida]TKK84688.1 hypothetical protein FDA94_29175 [Herbidospora galbida]